VRVVTRSTVVPAEDLRAAWRTERSNLDRIHRLYHRRGIAQLLLVADPGRPGFSVFARPDAPLLEDFGRGLRLLGLHRAVRFTRSLIQEIRACWDEGLITYWPDKNAVAIRGDDAILLDPVAAHFGDLGPPQYFDRHKSEVRRLTEREMLSALTYVAATALGRIVGLLPEPDKSDRAIGVERIEHHLMESRRAEVRSVDVDATMQLAGLMAAALSPDPGSRPDLASLQVVLDKVGRGSTT
jgi:hypothetical protein